MKMEKKDVLKLTKKKRKVKRCIYQSKKKENEVKKKDEPICE